VTFRLGFASSRRQARQLVRHGHVEVNGRKVNIPSFQVGVGDEIKIRANSEKLTLVESSREFASHQPAPSWLSSEPNSLSGKVLALPRREDINLPVNEQLIVELYSK
jgi:small subunit ribosomal protein S4